MKLRTLLLFSILRCSAYPSSSQVTNIDVLAGLKNAKDLKLSQLVSDVEFIYPESTNESYLPGFSGCSIGKQFIIAYFGEMHPNQYRVNLYDIKGKFIRHIGKIGRGPGEYIPPYRAVLDPSEKHVVVIDMSQQKLIKFDLNGKLILERNYKSDDNSQIILDQCFVGENLCLSFTRPPSPMDGFANIIMYNPDLKPIRRILERPNNPDQSLFELSTCMVSQPTGLSFWESSHDTVYHIMPDGKVEPAFHFTISKGGWPKDALRVGNLNRDQRGDYLSISNVTDLPGYLLFWARKDKFHMLVLDKKTKQVFTVSNHPGCLDPDARGVSESFIENDLFGVERMGLRVLADQKAAIDFIAPAYFGQDIKCLREKKVLMPEKRDQLLNYIEKATGEENPIIVIMHLK